MNIARQYQKHLEKVEAQNAEFEAASTAKRRVLIAKDALELVHASILEPENGEYGRLFAGDDYILYDDSAPMVNLKDVIVNKMPTCFACARGGLLFAAILRRNNVENSVFQGSGIIEEFSDDMLMAMENVFEACDLNTGIGINRDLDLLLAWDVATEEMSDCSTYRFTRIMQWLIDHDGEFDPEAFLRTETEIALRLLEKQHED